MLEGFLVDTRVGRVFHARDRMLWVEDDAAKKDVPIWVTRSSLDTFNIIGILKSWGVIRELSWCGRTRSESSWVAIVGYWIITNVATIRLIPK